MPTQSFQTPREVAAQSMWQAPSSSSPTAAVATPRARARLAPLRTGGTREPAMVQEGHPDGEMALLAGAPVDQE